MSNLIVEKHDGYAIFTLNRPDEMNALSRALRAELIAALADCGADPAIQVLILTGRGRAFCAGLDLKELSEAEGDSSGDVNNDLVKSMAAFDGPIIGAINGHAVTGGFELALACDVLIAAEGARFADTHARVGLLPGWGLSQTLPRLIGLSRAKEVSFTGKPVFAAQAYDWGLVNHVVPAEELLPRAIEMARAMCATVPGVLPRYKALIDQGYCMPYDQALAWEEEQSIIAAREVMGSEIAARRDAVLEQGRSEKGE